MLKAIRPGDPSAGLIARCLRTGQLPERLDVNHLCGILRDRAPGRWRAQLFAVWLLGRIPLQESDKESVVRSLCLALSGDSRPTGASSAISRALGLALALTLFTVALGVLFGTPDSHVVRAWGLVPIWLISGFALLPSYRAGDRANQNDVRRMAAGALGRLQTVDSVAALARAARDPDYGIRAASARGLAAALPLLRPEHYGHLGSSAVPDLCRLLEVPAGLSPLCVLDALEKVGDGRALVPVEHFAAHRAVVAVKERAERLIPILRERQRQESDPHRLLRPAAAPPAEALLRPAGHESEYSSRSLLRPTSPDAEGDPTLEEVAGKNELP